MNCLRFLFPAAVFFAACNSSTPINKTENDSANGKAVVVPPQMDSFPVDTKNSAFVCTRSKTVKDVDKTISLFGSSVKLTMDTASFSATTSIAISGGSWYTTAKKFSGGKIILDMTSVSAVQVGKDDKPEMGNPGYLETEKYPSAILKIGTIDSASGDSPVQFQITATLTLKDSTGEIFPEHVKCSMDHNEIPSRLVFDFSIDGKKWGLNRKDAKVLKDRLTFHVVIAEAEKH